jgi:hypothetical protein
LTVLEHGAGRPRADFEDEREELARRFREKYGSHHPSGEARRSNVAPYFVGVFDTVAALGASGPRRWAIQAGLSALIALGALVQAIVIGILGAIVWGLSFWLTAGIVEAAVVIAGILWLLFKQRRNVRKTIHDFPNPGDKRSHLARWEGRYFNRLLSRFVTYARSANAIDETRADFDRVPWGPTAEGPKETAGFRTLRQVFFAGNHSDVGGSYAEVESRLSDIALAWMLEEVSVPNGLRVGPVYVNGAKMAGSGEQGTTLYLYPADDGVQHNEISAMRDYLDAIKPRVLAWLLRNKNYAEKVRFLPDEAEVHPSVFRRFELAGVLQADGFRPYRPRALRNVTAFAKYYPATAAAVATTDTEPSQARDSLPS